MIFLWVIWPSINSLLVNEGPRNTTWGRDWCEGEPWKSSLCSGTIFQCLFQVSSSYLVLYIHFLYRHSINSCCYHSYALKRCPWTMQRKRYRNTNNMSVTTTLLSFLGKIKPSMNRRLLISSLPTKKHRLESFWGKSPSQKMYWSHLWINIGGWGWNLPPPFPIRRKLH